MAFGRGTRRHALVDSVVARAQVFPPGDYRRWQVIAELATADFKAAFERASTLIRTADTASMVLGAEMLDELFIGLREGRRFAHQAAELLRPLCRAAQDPEVLCAALPPYLQLNQAAQPLLYELLEHPDERVRRTAAQLIAGVGAEFASNRQVESLIALLDRDPDQGVREQAAESLELILTCYPYVAQSQRIVETLTGRLDDPTPGIRASALAGISALHPDTALRRLVAELAAPQPCWQFVDCFSRLPPLDDHDTGTAELWAQAHMALRRLHEQEWPQHADPTRFPVPHERADMLGRAISVTAPEHRSVPVDRRRVARPRRADALD